MDSKSVADRDSPVQLRVIKIAPLPKDIDKALDESWKAVSQLRKMNVSDSGYLAVCSRFLKSMCSFEYLDNVCRLNGSLLSAANDLHGLLYVLKKDNGVSSHCMRDEYSAFRRRVGTLLQLVVNKAHGFRRQKVQEQAKLLKELASEIQKAEGEARDLTAQSRNILLQYSKLLTDQIELKYQPLKEFLTKLREFQKFKSSMELAPQDAAPESEAETSAVVSFVAVASKKLDQQKGQQQQLKSLNEVVGLAHKRFESSKPALCSSLGNLNGRVLLLHNHAICKPMNLARLDPSIVIYSFFHLLAGASNSPLRLLVNDALKKIPHQAKLRMILQRYICEAHDIPEIAQASK
jgi:hypothetical protein